jgi:hypothetical protein
VSPKDNGTIEQVTLPVSDTVPGPGNYTAGVVNLHGPGLPVIDSTDLISSMGAGTAEDIPSVLQTPVPGRDFGESTKTEDKGSND